VDHHGNLLVKPLEEELTRWWEETARAEIKNTVPKSVEYGAYDLQLIGTVLADMIGWDETKTARTESVHVELGCFFYALGKIARMQSAYRRSELPSDDTPFDAGVYLRMAQRARSHGGWPGAGTEVGK